MVPYVWFYLLILELGNSSNILHIINWIEVVGGGKFNCQFESVDLVTFHRENNVRTLNISRSLKAL